PRPPPTQTHTPTPPPPEPPIPPPPPPPPRVVVFLQQPAAAAPPRGRGGGGQRCGVGGGPRARQKCTGIGGSSTRHAKRPFGPRRLASLATSPAERGRNHPASEKPASGRVLRSPRPRRAGAGGDGRGADRFDQPRRRASLHEFDEQHPAATRLH